MNDTGFFLLMNTVIQIAIFALAAIVIMFLARQALRYGAAVAAAEGDSPRPAFPMMSLFFKGLFVIILLMAGFTINVWLPKSEVRSRSVNATVERQITQDTERENVVVPVVEPSAVDAQSRASRVEDIREQFNALPDAE